MEQNRLQQTVHTKGLILSVLKLVDNVRAQTVEVTPEPSIGEIVLNAFKDPSFEHFPIYFVFAATIMAISAFAYAAMPQNKVQGITYELGEALEEKEYIGKDNDEYFKELEAAKPFLASAEDHKVLS